MLIHEITRQFLNSTEKIIAKFADEKDAAEFMEAKISWDHRTKVKTVYRLYTENTVILEINSAEYETLGSTDTGKSGHGSAPTPMPSGLKPPGTPSSHYSKGDIDDDNEI